MKSKITVFFGSDKKVGTTFLSLRFALALAEKEKEKKIIFIGANQGSAVCYVKEANDTMDKLVPLIENDIFSVESLVRYSKPENEIFYIEESKDMILSATYKPGVLKRLVKKLGDDFDYVVIDAGENLSNGLTIAGISMKDTVIYAVLSQKESALKGFEERRKIISRIGIKPKKYIVNMYDREDPYDMQYISKRINLGDEAIYKVPFVKDMQECERENNVFAVKSRNLDNSINLIVTGYLESLEEKKLSKRGTCYDHEKKEEDTDEEKKEKALNTIGKKGLFGKILC